MIKRGLKKTSTGEITQIKSELVVDEVSYLCSPKEMRSKIITLLNYPKELITKDPSLLYRYTVYNPQEETKKILRIKKEERYELLGKIFSIDRYKLIKENANILKKNIRDEGEYLKGVFSNLEDYKKQCKMQSGEIVKLKKEELELEEKLAGINEKKSVLNEKDKALSRKALEFERIKKRFEIEFSLRKEKTNYLIELKQRDEDEKKSCAKIEEQIKEFALVEKEVDEEKIIELIKEKHTIEKEIQEYADNKKNIQIKLAGLEQRIKDKEEFILKKDKAKDELIKMQKEIVQIMQSIKDKEGVDASAIEEEKNIKKNRDFLSSKNTHIQILKKEIEEIRALSVCPLCKQNVHPAHKSNIIGENQKIIDTTNIELESLERAIEEGEKKILLLRKKANELINEKEKLNYFEKNYAELKNEEKQIEEEKEKILVLTKEKTIIDLDLEKIDKFDAGKVKEKIEEINKKIIDFEKEKKDIQRRNDLIKFIDEKKKNMQSILEAKIKTAKSITDLTKSIHVLTKEIALQDGLESDIKKIKEEKEVIFTLLETQKIALAQVKEKINSFETQSADILKKIEMLSLSKKKYEKINQIVNW
ncbi:MAG: hypothetical protein KAQ92_08305, partial [Candidatus Aenigmarchaeota archaeon]|nr:hypothetical protein [Candidatus Aenigmarchaeota archaeon]